MHGSDGPLHITGDAHRGKRSEDAFLEAAAELGYPVIDDLHDTKDALGFERESKTVTADGKRHDAATAYVHPLVNDGQHPNLHVLCESKVNRVLFDDDKRAIGVEYMPNTDYFVIAPSTEHQPRTTVRARKMVIVTAGALGSSLILNARGSASAKVPVIEDLPSVGTNYQDHNLFWSFYKTDFAPEESLDALWSGRMPPEEAAAKGLMTCRGCDVHGKLRPSDAEVEDLGAEFAKHWKEEYSEIPGKPLMMMATVAAFLGDPSLVPEGSYYGVGSYTAYPRSRGHVHISGPNWDDPADFETGFLTDEHDLDLKKCVWAYKLMREVARRTSFYRGELPIGHPAFATDSDAALLDLDKSLGASGKPIKNIAYTAEDDRAIEQFIREHVSTTWHSLGTCALAPRERGGVVDDELNVYGVRALKVVDLSIPPKNVGANTQITAYTIGEKGADIILKELGIKVKQGSGQLNGHA
ncbi:hypothetical protein LTR53_002500 [Teratosphaeriaceae sp. CCFEE 6253]|nr:hypothetical protein LTR53_002500 [Teratosphaeriaceae sp. CCFEE 6253]